MGEFGGERRVVVLLGLVGALLDGRRVRVGEVLLQGPEDEADRREEEVGERALQGRDRVARLVREQLAVVELDVGAVAAEDGALPELVVGEVDHGLMDDHEGGEDGGAAARQGSVQPLAVDDVHEDAAPEHGAENGAEAKEVDAGSVLAGVVARLEVVAPLEEESEEDDDVVALRDDLGALLAEHQAEDEDGRAVGHRRDGVDEEGEDARQAEDEVDEAVGEGEAGLAADLLVDWVAEVDHRAHRGAKEGADDGEEAVGDHGLADRVGVARIPGAGQCHEAGGARANGHGEHDAEVLADFLEALDEGATDPEAAVGGVELVALLGGGGELVGVGGDDARDDPVERLGDLEAHDVERALGEVAQEDHEHGDEARCGGAEAGRDLVEAEPRDADARHGHGECVDGHHLEDRVAEPRDAEEDADEDIDEAHDEVGRASCLPRRLDGPRRGRDGEHDVEERRVHADGVDAVRLGGEVAAELRLHARGHVRVVHVADEQRDAQRGDDARVHDLLGLANLASSATNVELDDGAAGDDGGKIVEEKGDQARDVASGWLQVLYERAAAGGLEVGRLLPVAHVRWHHRNHLPR
mmetsp:Transcript_29240/g.74109  ORF Transcript_29240/g.74109 Transcript_29240/m.74109 type:complete len:584 (+) Transcript_29240:430-2181(+)